MTDLHAHILPNLDDGPATMEESLAMVRKGWEEGIDTICATPHLMEEPSQEAVDRFTHSFQSFQEQISSHGPPVNLALGSEVYFQTGLEKILGFPGLTLNGTGKYLLIELPMQEIPRGAEQIIFSLVMAGMIPILAHPERNFSVLKDEALLEPIVRAGALIQVNAGSLEGQFGRQVKKTTLSLLKKGLVQLIGSDAHSAASRPVRLTGAVENAAQVVGQEMAQLMVTDYPQRILAGQPLPSNRPLPSEASRRTLLGKVWRGMTRK